MGPFLQVQITQSANEFGLLKKSKTQSYGWRKQSKCIFDSYRRFEFSRFDISEFEQSRVDCSITVSTEGVLG